MPTAGVLTTGVLTTLLARGEEHTRADQRATRSTEDNVGDSILRDGLGPVRVPYMGDGRQMPTAILKHERDVQVVEVHGEIDLACVGALDAVLDRAIEECAGADRGYRRTARDAVVDLRAVWFMDVQGLHSMIGHQYALQAMDGELLLVCQERRIHRLLEVAGVAGMFTIYGSLARAIATARTSL